VVSVAGEYAPREVLTLQEQEMAVDVAPPGTEVPETQPASPNTEPQLSPSR